MKNFKLFSKDKNDPNTLTGRSMIVPIIFCLVCGILLVFFGNLAVRITAYALSGVMIFCGLWSVFVYIRSKPIMRITESRLATGLILLVAGAMLAFNPGYLDDSMVYIWGLALLFGGFLKIQYAFDEMSVNVNKWWIMLIFAAFSIIVGILALLNPAFLGESRNLVIGILLVLEAVLDITVYFLLKHALKKHLDAETAAQQATEEAVSAEPAEPETAAEPEQTVESESTAGPIKNAESQESLPQAEE